MIEEHQRHQIVERFASRLEPLATRVARALVKHVGSRTMGSGLRLAAIVLLSFMPLAEATAASLEWRRYAIPATGLSVDVPISVFDDDKGATEGALGRHLFTKDYRANLTIKSIPNPDNDSPAVFLEKMRPPADTQYRRVTPKFFAVSGVRNGHTWYNRCNRANGFMNCVLINYPAVEERQWDAIVTRIVLSQIGSWLGPRRLLSFAHSEKILSLDVEPMKALFMTLKRPPSASGRHGLEWCETDVEATDLETTSAICSTANIRTRCASSVSM